MRIVRDPPLSLPASASPALAVLKAPWGLTAFEADRPVAGIVVFQAQGHIEIATDEGLFLLGGRVELSPGERVILLPEPGDGVGVRLHRIATAPSGACPAAADTTAAGGNMKAAGSAAAPTLDADAPPVCASNIIDARLPVRILSANAATATPSLTQSTASSPACKGQVSIRVLAVADAANSVGCEIRLPPQAARTFEAIVTASRADGTVLRADGSPVLLLPPGLHLREGTRIVFAFEPAPAAVDAARPETPFEVVGALMKLVGSRAAIATRSSIVRLLPRPDKALPALAAAFLKALQAGDASVWLGPDAEARLAQDLPDILDRLHAAWNNTRGMEADAQEQWQTWTIPLLTMDGLSLIHVCRERARTDREDERNNKNMAAVRVIFDCTFTRLGRVQVDTQFRKPSRCDLVIRTKTPLEPPVRNALGLAHAHSAAVLGLTGELNYRAAEDAFIDAGPPQSPTAGPLSLTI